MSINNTELQNPTSLFIYYVNSLSNNTINNYTFFKFQKTN